MVRSSSTYRGGLGETRDASTEFSGSETSNETTTTTKTKTTKGKDTLNLFGND